MISFKEVTAENKSSLCDSLSDGLDTDAAIYFRELINSIDTADDDISYAVCVHASCALIRIFDMGRHFFAFPCELSDGADVLSAVDAVCEYAMREEIPIVFVDVPSEELSAFVGYRHMDIDADDPECCVYRVRIKNECELCSEIPHVQRGRVELCMLSEADIPLYAALCKDEKVNKYWGYNYSEDIADPCDGYFFENAALEFERGIAVTMAVRSCSEFIGEATVYAFDGKGGAEFSIRLLPAYQGRGLGTESVLAITDAARKIGLVRLRAKIMRDNLASIAMLGKVTDISFEDDECICFVIEL